MLWVDQGAKLFAQRCASCHDSLKGVAARYPRVVDGRILTLEEKIRQKGPLAYESDELLALTAYVAHQSRGMPIQIDVADADLLRGRTAYLRRRGQMNLACTHCHDAHAGMKLGAETISQGQPNGYPAYRLEWQKMGSLSRRIRSCMLGLHAELPPFGSELLLELELYLGARAATR
jgi:sulfur-oxidizing protein SoxA